MKKVTTCSGRIHANAVRAWEAAHAAGRLSFRLVGLAELPPTTRSFIETFLEDNGVPAGSRSLFHR